MNCTDEVHQPYNIDRLLGNSQDILRSNINSTVLLSLSLNTNKYLNCDNITTYLKSNLSYVKFLHNFGANSVSLIIWEN